MGMSIAASSGKSSRHRSNSEINVTPMVDVMLVLLVIFMITAPTLKEGLSVDIPRADATQSINIEEAHLVTVTSEGYVLKSKASTVEERYKKIPELVSDLKAYIKTCEAEKKKPTVVIVGDGNAKYERIVQVWNAVINSGVEQVSFQVEPGKLDTRL